MPPDKQVQLVKSAPEKQGYSGFFFFAGCLAFLVVKNDSNALRLFTVQDKRIINNLCSACPARVDTFCIIFPIIYIENIIQKFSLSESGNILASLQPSSGQTFVSILRLRSWRFETICYQGSILLTSDSV